jgi:SRSO17 transposase
MVRDPLRPEQPLNAESLIVVIVGSRVISPEQQDEDGVFLLVQFEVIAWADEKKQRRRRNVVVSAWAGLISWSMGGISFRGGSRVKFERKIGGKLGEIGGNWGEFCWISTKS